jgi:hypothetical protein
MSAPVTLQINVAPSDLPHAEPILRHQLRQWAGQVDEVLFTYDVDRGTGRTRFAEGWDERRPAMDRLLDDLCAGHPGAHVDEVDTGAPATQAVGDRFFGGAAPPLKDARGGPFFSYFWGVHRARHEVVFHTDSDMLFGGGSQAWVADALGLMEQHPDVLATSPLPGPPRADGRIRARRGSPLAEVPYPAYRFGYFTSRLFMLDRGRLLDRSPALELRRPHRLQHRLKARVLGNPPVALPEDLVSRRMRQRSQARIDLLGSGPGMWSLHPPYRSPEFYARLPELVERVERDDIPDGQRGEYDINDSFFAWGAARRQHRLGRLVR